MSEEVDRSLLLALPPPTEAELPPRAPLVPERTNFLEGDTPAAAKVEAFLARIFHASF